MNMKKILCALCHEVLFDENITLTLILNVFGRSSNLNLKKLIITNNHSMNPKIPRVESWVTKYANLQFFKLFRVAKATLEDLVDSVGRTDSKHILSRPYTGGHHPINITEHMLIFLWYMATQDSLISIGTRFNVSASTVMGIVNKILYFILKLKKTIIKFPRNKQELQDVANGFNKYPGVVGAIDGSHIFIKAEANQQDSYIDRYRRHSIILMAICDANTLFTYIFAGFPGSAHDSRVFENSIFFKNIEQFGPNYYFLDFQKYHLIGDSAFGLKTWLMTPYRRNNITRKQIYHNRCLSSERVVIEHTFGLLKGRWRRTQFINTYNISKTIEIATAACILHNVCILRNDIWTEEYFDNEGPIFQYVAGEQNNAALLKRNRIANNLFDNRN